MNLRAWQKHMGRRKYARVGTMDKSDRYMAEMEIPMNYPEGDGRVLGQVTPTTNFTPAGLHAETFGGNFQVRICCHFWSNCCSYGRWRNC